MSETKGDGTELCCIVNPIRKCIGCSLTLCMHHWWRPFREKLGLDKLPFNDVEGIEKTICPRCQRAVNRPLDNCWDLPTGISKDDPYVMECP